MNAILGRFRLPAVAIMKIKSHLFELEFEISLSALFQELAKTKKITI